MSQAVLFPRSRLQSAPFLLTLLAAWLLATLGLRPLLLPDEGRYADVARRMLSGDVLVPRLDGLPFFHKPPLFYWLDIAAMQLVGVNQFAGRFGSAIGAWLMGAALFFAMRRWHGPRVAAIALGVLATTPFFFIGGQYANHDMLVGGLITAAVLAFARAVDAPAIDLRWLVAGWMFCGFAILAKGLIGFVLPAFVIGPWLLAQGRWRQMLRLLHPLGLLAFAVVALPWCVAMQLRYPGFFDYFIVEQHFRRFAQSDFNNVHGVWFFIVLLPALALPWSAWLVRALRDAWSRRGVPPMSLYAWWVVAIVGFFSIPSSKLVGYALPALAPWCALMALAIAAPRADGKRPVWPWVMGASAIACVALVIVGVFKTPNSNEALARVLGTQMSTDDRVVMVAEYDYDVPFYARLARPVVIVDDWADPEIPHKDNWRKEIFDPARFEPALGAELLQPLDKLEAQACNVPHAWFIVDPSRAPRVAAMAGAARMFAARRAELWRVPGHSC
jgi:4-amino-4-deoxy-L-arabinose transferase-like glycosyltransferase